MDDHLKKLLASYSAAITDFYGSGTTCVYKTGPPWPVAQGRAQNLVRAARPIYDHGIAQNWLQTAKQIAAELDALEVRWNAIDPLAYANAGQAALICDCVIVVNVEPRSIAFEAAAAAATAVVGIIEAAGFPAIQVAFRESIYRRRQGKFMGFNPTYEPQGLPSVCKPFTPTLGLAIAPHKTPHFEGTGGVFIRLTSDESDQRVFLLTCAHVAHPPPVFENKVYTRKANSQPREDVVLLGTGAFDESVGAIIKLIGDRTQAIPQWQTPPPAAGEADRITKTRKLYAALIEAAEESISAANDLHSCVTTDYALLDSRVLGFTFHCAEIEVGADGYMYDWALVQLDVDKLADFKGNLLFVGGNQTAAEWQNFMFPQTHDHRDFHVPKDLLLQLGGHVREEEFRDPQHYDVYDEKALLAVKNGRTTGTTFGRVNGLESITREYTAHGLAVDALEFIVCGYDTKTRKRDIFSDEGDSGSMVVDRLGRLIGLLTGGGGPTNATDRTYITPYYALKKEIEKTYLRRLTVCGPGNYSDELMGP